MKIKNSFDKDKNILQFSTIIDKSYKVLNKNSTKIYLNNKTFIRLDSYLK